MRHGDAELIGEGAPGLKGEQVVSGQQGFAAENDRPEENNHKAKQTDNYHQGQELVSVHHGETIILRGGQKVNKRDCSLHGSENWRETVAAIC